MNAACDFGPLITLEMYGQLLGWKKSVEEREDLLFQRFKKAMAAGDAPMDAKEGNMKNTFLAVYKELHKKAAKHARTKLHMLMCAADPKLPSKMRELLKFKALNPSVDLMDSKKKMTDVMQVMCINGPHKVVDQSAMAVLSGYDTKEWSAEEKKRCWDLTVAEFKKYQFVGDKEEAKAVGVGAAIDISAKASPFKTKAFTAGKVSDWFDTFYEMDIQVKLRKELAMVVMNCSKPGFARNTKGLCGLLKMRALGKMRKPEDDMTMLLSTCCNI